MTITTRIKAGKYEICAQCGAHLDPGERCDCSDHGAEASTLEVARSNESSIYNVEMQKK